MTWVFMLWVGLSVTSFPMATKDACIKAASYDYGMGYGTKTFCIDGSTGAVVAVVEHGKSGER